MNRQYHITPAVALKKLCAGIRAECAKQGIDDDTRRAMMSRVAGVGSSKDLDLRGANAVLAHLRRSDGRRQRTEDSQHAGASRPVTEQSSVIRPQSSENEWRFVFSCAAARQKYLRKIYRQAETLGAMQSPPVTVMPKKYVEGIARQMVSAATLLEFCGEDTLHAIVQALETHIQRSRRNAPVAFSDP
ncbi:MAG: regulatory protein GemA [Zoogloeaceae bacterium]|jgi:phage gp16-like protein|nr:regulatory protein GemA [Zoogloeaceae bacterium]